MYIEIKNAGEIDVNAMVLIGASTKREDEGKIGFFGSGLKYAMAVLIRNGVKFHVFSGTNEIAVGIYKKEFRGQEFNQIFINGEPTSLTAEMGIDWEPWFALRELYCNALDEGQCSFRVVHDIEPVAGTTAIYVQKSEIFDKLLNNWDMFFSDRRQDIMLSTKGLRLFHGDDNFIIYRKGVQCHVAKYIDMKCLYHYDIEDIEINESRTLRYPHLSTWKTAKLLALHASPSVIKNIYDHEGETVEDSFYWNQFGMQFNENWLEVLAGRSIVIKSVAGWFTSIIDRGNCLILPRSLAMALKEQWPAQITIHGELDNDSGFTVVEENAKQKHYIEQALSFLKGAGYEIPNPIKVCVFDVADRLGQVSGKTILLSVDVFDLGKKEVAATILEEFIHIHYGVIDNSRAMQDLLFKLWMSEMENRLNVFL